MDQRDTVIVTTEDGLHGVINPSSQALDGSQSQVQVQMEDGQQVWVPYDLLDMQADGSYYLPISLAQLTGLSTTRLSDERETVLPVIEERPVIERRQVSKGRVRVTKRVHERQERVDEPGYRERVNVVRVKVDQVLDEPVGVRYEGETMVIPVIEEVLVVEKKLVLREEVRITKLREEVHNPQELTLRREEVSVERIEAGAD